MPTSQLPDILYQYYDLCEQQKTRFLHQLERDNPQLASELKPFIEAEAANTSLLTELIAGQAEQILADDDRLFELEGTALGKYRLRHLLGRGGMGVVYQAERFDETFEQTLAIKISRPRLQAMLGSGFLYQEAQLLARLNHPYIAKVFDGGRENGLAYIVMEKVDGDPLGTFLQRRSIPVKEKLVLFERICQAIAHAHQNHILHADLKPENILIQPDCTPKVLDFNITGNGNSEMRALSREFASPEQAAGEYLTTQSDVYSLGRLLEWMLGKDKTGKEAALIIAKACDPDPVWRYQSVASLAEDICALLSHHPLSMQRLQFRQVAVKAARRHPFRTGVLVSLLALLIGFNHVLASKNAQLASEKKLAEQMVFEMTALMFNSKQDAPLGSILELTRRRVLANPELPGELKQKLLTAMVTPIPAKQQLSADCGPECNQDKK